MKHMEFFFVFSWVITCQEFQLRWLQPPHFALTAIITADIFFVK